MILDINKQRATSDHLNLFMVQLPSGYAYFCDYFEDVYLEDFEAPYTIRKYLSIPAEFTGFDAKAEGSLSRPRIRIGNVLSVFKDAIGIDVGDLEGKRLIRRQVLASQLNSAANYPGTGSQPTEYPKQVFMFEKIEERNAITISYELSSPMDLAGIKIPYRQISKFCTWAYQGAALDRAGDLFGACFWKEDNTNPGFETLYTNTENPIFDSGSVTPTTHSGGAYTQDSLYRVATTEDFYAVSGSITSGSTYDYWHAYNDGTGTLASALARRCYGYVDHQTSTQYLRAVNPSYSDIVKYNNKIYRCIRSHDETKLPDVNPSYWERIDLCSKTLRGCSYRFQSSATSDGIPSLVTLDKSKELPYGGFPGAKGYG